MSLIKMRFIQRLETSWEQVKSVFRPKDNEAFLTTPILGGDICAYAKLLSDLTDSNRFTETYAHLSIRRSGSGPGDYPVQPTVPPDLELPPVSSRLSLSRSLPSVSVPRRPTPGRILRSQLPSQSTVFPAGRQSRHHGRRTRKRSRVENTRNTTKRRRVDDGKSNPSRNNDIQSIPLHSTKRFTPNDKIQSTLDSISTFRPVVQVISIGVSIGLLVSVSLGLSYYPV